MLGALGHYCVARALGYAPANVVSPFQYFQLLGSVAVGWLVFDDLPDALTWVGAGVIVLSGLFIGWSQTRPSNARPKAAAPTAAGAADRTNIRCLNATLPSR